MSGELAGIRVIVTRSSLQSAELLRALAERGADAVALPLLEVLPPEDPRPLERAASELALYQWLVLTSANAAASLLEASGGAVPARLQIAVIGNATARALRDYEIEPALIADESHAEGFAAQLAPRVGRRQRVLLPQAEDARPLLAEQLEAAGAEVVRVTAYRKRSPAGAAEQARALFAALPWGWVTFTSPSTVRNLVDALGETLWSEGRSTLDAATIGPTTSAELRKFGAEPAVEAGSPGAASLVDSIAAAVLQRRRASSQRNAS